MARQDHSKNPASKTNPAQTGRQTGPGNRITRSASGMKWEIVVMTSRRDRGPHVIASELHNEPIFTEYEQDLFSHVVAKAEKEGRPVKLVVLPSSQIFESIVQTASQLQCSEILMGVAKKMSPDLQAKALRQQWEKLPDAPGLTVIMVGPEGRKWRFELGPPAPHVA